MLYGIELLAVAACASFAAIVLIFKVQVVPLHCKIGLPRFSSKS